MAYLGAWLSRTPVLLRTESHLMRSRPATTEFAKSVILRALFRFTAAFLAIGEANTRFYEYYGLPPEKMFWTPYCVDNEYLISEQQRLARDREAIRQEIGISPGRSVIIYSGKLIERKRVEDLLQAVKLLSPKSQVAELLILGDGPRRALLIGLADSLDLRVRFVGFQNQSQLARYYVCGDVFVLPSSYETWGLVVNEAMAFGMPIVTTSVVGAGVDLVTPGITGYTYEPGDCAALAACLDPLLKDAEARRRMGEAALRRVGPYNLDECVKGVLAALQFVSAGQQRRVPQNAAG